MKKTFLILAVLVLIGSQAMAGPPVSVVLADNVLVTRADVLTCMKKADTQTKLTFTGAATDTFVIIEDGTPITFTHEGLDGDATTQYDVTNTSGTTFRYTYDGTGTTPNITATDPAVGSTVVITGFATANNGTFEVIAAATNYFEITNASGSAENNITGVTVNTLEQYVKTGGISSLRVNWTAVTGTPAVELNCYKPEQP